MMRLPMGNVNVYTLVKTWMSTNEEDDSLWMAGDG